MWSISEITNIVEACLVREANRLELEQAVYGLDTHDELIFHSLLARSLADAGYGVFREQRYPGQRCHKKRSAGVRCDLVLTPDNRPLATPDELPTLFDPPNPIPLEDAFWIEVKLVAQFTSAGPNRRYSSLYGALRRDVAKLCQAASITHRALLVLLFAQDDTVAEHDLEIWTTQCADRGLEIGTIALRSVSIGDRLGNTICKVGCYRIKTPGSDL